MTARRAYPSPPVWDDETLERDRRQAIADFIAARGAEGSARYGRVVAGNLVAVEGLFAATRDLLDLASGDALTADPRLILAARYLGGPPVSADDLDTLAEARIATRKRLDADLGRKAARVIMAAVDREPHLQPSVTRRRDGRPAS